MFLYAYYMFISFKSSFFICFGPNFSILFVKPLFNLIKFFVYFPLLLVFLSFMFIFAKAQVKSRPAHFFSRHTHSPQFVVCPPAMLVHGISCTASFCHTDFNSLEL